MQHELGRLHRLAREFRQRVVELCAAQTVGGEAELARILGEAEKTQAELGEEIARLRSGEADGDAE